MPEINPKPILSRQVAIATSIVNAQYDLEAIQKSIIYLALAGINQTQPIEISAEHKIMVADFAYLRGRREKDKSLVLGKVIPIRFDDAKEELNNAVKSLYNSSIRFSKDEEHRWITGYKLCSEEQVDYVKIKWNPDLLPHLAELKTYSNLIAGSTAGIKGKYTFRILELISQGKMRGRKTGSVYIELEEFLGMIEAKSTYREFKYLMKFVLKTSIKELQEKEIAYVKVRSKKVGRNVVGFSLDYILG